METPHFGLYAFIDGAGWVIEEILDYLPEGKVKVLGTRPCSHHQIEMVTDTYHLVAKIC